VATHCGCYSRTGTFCVAFGSRRGIAPCGAASCLAEAATRRSGRWLGASRRPRGPGCRCLPCCRYCCCVSPPSRPPDGSWSTSSSWVPRSLSTRALAECCKRETVDHPTVRWLVLLVGVLLLQGDARRLAPLLLLLSPFSLLRSLRRGGGGAAGDGMARLLRLAMIGISRKGGRQTQRKGERVPNFFRPQKGVDYESLVPDVPFLDTIRDTPGGTTLKEPRTQGIP
jgi:hypothetical protein